MQSVKIGDKLYGYNFNYRWGLSASKYVFTIERETKTLWILFINGVEHQRVRKSDLSVYGSHGVRVYTKEQPEQEKSYKEIIEYKELRKLLQKADKDLLRHPLNEKQIKLLEFLRSVDENND